MITIYKLIGEIPSIASELIERGVPLSINYDCIMIAIIV